jgi:tetratricopeptide (TPR) repeat protein
LSFFKKILFSKTLLTPNGNNNDTKVLLKKAKKYRKQKKYNLAKSTYEEVLKIDPTEVRAYNGIRKILLDKKNKEYEVILLYQQALTHLPNRTE